MSQSVNASCRQMTQEEYFTSDYIFDAEYIRPAISIWNAIYYITGTKKKVSLFRVIKAYKGDVSEGDIVKIDSRVDKRRPRFIMFAFQHPSTGNFTSSHCKIAMFPNLSIGGLKIYASEIKGFDDKLAKDPHNTDIMFEKAKFLEQYSDYKSAESVYKKIFKKIIPSWRDIELNNVFQMIEEENQKILSDGFYVFAKNNYRERDFYNALKLSRLSYFIKNDNRKEILYHLSAIMVGDVSELNGKSLNLERADIVKIDGINLSNMDFKNSNFRFSNLWGIDFTNSDLSNSNFHGSKFDKINFTGANLDGVDFSLPRRHGGWGGSVNFTNASLKGANFTNHKFKKETIFEGANVSNANLTGSTIPSLNGAILSSSNLSRMIAYSCNYAGLDLSNQNISSSTFHGCDFRGSDLTNSDLSNTAFGWDADDNVSDFRGANLTGVKIENTGFIFALYDCDTIFSEDFDPEKQFMIPVWGKNCEGEAPKTDFSNVWAKKNKLVKSGVHLGGTIRSISNKDLRGTKIRNLSENGFGGL